MPYKKLFHICLFISIFLHLVSCPSAIAAYSGPLDYNTSSLQKTLSDKNTKSDFKSGPPGTPALMWGQSFTLEAEAHEKYIHNISAKQLASLASLATTRLVL
ncbi:hypothetical protein ACFL43_07390 [Thermodesulfobacteriota bacterium]